jgi:hypothetical protein
LHVNNVERHPGKDSGTKFEDIKTQRLREKANHLQKLLNERVPLPEKVYVVSCADDLQGIPEFQCSLIEKLKETDERPLLMTYSTISCSWHMSACVPTKRMVAPGALSMIASIQLPTISS